MCRWIEVDRQWKFHFRPYPKVGQKWRIKVTYRNRMCHRKWRGTFGRKPKPKPKVNRIWADTTIEASKSHPVFVAQLSRTSDIFHISPIMSAVRRVINDTATQYQMQTQTTHWLPRYSQHTVRLMAPRVWRTLRNSSSVTYFRQPLNLPTAARRNRKCTECDTTAFSRKRMSAESAHLSTFGTETEAEIRSTSIGELSGPVAVASIRSWLTYCVVSHTLRIFTRLRCNIFVHLCTLVSHFC